MLCEMHCNLMQRREHVHETRRDEHKVSRPHQVKERGSWRTAIVCALLIVLMEAVHLVWTTMTKANGRFRLRLFFL